MNLKKLLEVTSLAGALLLGQPAVEKAVKYLPENAYKQAVQEVVQSDAKAYPFYFQNYGNSIIATYINGDDFEGEPGNHKGSSFISIVGEYSDAAIKEFLVYGVDDYYNESNISLKNLTNGDEAKLIYDEKTNQLILQPEQSLPLNPTFNLLKVVYESVRYNGTVNPATNEGISLYTVEMTIQYGNSIETYKFELPLIGSKSVSEPISLWLTGTGLVALGAVSRWRRKNK